VHRRGVLAGLALQSTLQLQDADRRSSDMPHGDGYRPIDDLSALLLASDHSSRLEAFQSPYVQDLEGQAVRFRPGHEYQIPAASRESPLYGSRAAGLGVLL